MRQVKPAPKGKTARKGKAGLDTIRATASERMASQGSGKASLWKRRPMLGLTLGLVGVGLVGGLYAGGHFSRAFGYPAAAFESAFNRAGFSISAISLAGNERTQPDAAYGVLGVQKGQSIFGADPAQMRARLMHLPWVADAEVRRQFPGAVAVRLIEKRPFALWKNGSELDVVERSGAVITGAEANAFKHLPLIAGDGAPKAAAPFIDAVSRDKAVVARLKAAERIGERRWDLLLDGGVTVKLPEEGWEAQLGELERLIVEKGVLERDIELIDLRYPDSYVFKLHNGDSRPVLRDRHA